MVVRFVKNWNECLWHTFGSRSGLCYSLGVDGHSSVRSSRGEHNFSVDLVVFILQRVYAFEAELFQSSRSKVTRAIRGHYTTAQLSGKVSAKKSIIEQIVKCNNKSQWLRGKLQTEQLLVSSRTAKVELI